MDENMLYYSHTHFRVQLFLKMEIFLLRWSLCFTLVIQHWTRTTIIDKKIISNWENLKSLEIDWDDFVNGTRMFRYCRRLFCLISNICFLILRIKSIIFPYIWQNKACCSEDFTSKQSKRAQIQHKLYYFKYFSHHFTYLRYFLERRCSKLGFKSIYFNGLCLREGLRELETS